MLRPRGEQSRALTPSLPAAPQLQDLLSCPCPPGDAQGRGAGVQRDLIPLPLSPPPPTPRPLPQSINPQAKMPSQNKPSRRAHNNTVRLRSKLTEGSRSTGTPLALQSILPCSHSQHPARRAWQHPTLTGPAATFPRVHRDWPPLISLSHSVTLSKPQLPRTS